MHTPDARVLCNFDDCLSSRTGLEVEARGRKLLEATDKVRSLLEERLAMQMQCGDMKQQLADDRDVSLAQQERIDVLEREIQVTIYIPLDLPVHSIL